MDNLKTTNRLLLILVIPLVFYLLKTLNFIFIPLVFSMFIALLFLPMMRWMKKKKIPRSLSVILVVLIMIGTITLAAQLIRFSGKQILEVDDSFIEMAQYKMVSIVQKLDTVIGLDLTEDKSMAQQLLEKSSRFLKVGPTLSFVNSTLTMTLMTLFFAVLWISESINIERVLNKSLIKSRYSSVKTFITIERDLIKFIKVKFLISLLTGIGTGLVCYFFGVSFPVFWGLFAFLINFVQMVGSFIAVIAAGLFGFIELDMGGSLLFYILALTSVQVLLGAIMEPILMGKSFSINIITVLVMLMLWGYIWGIPGMIMSIPLTVFFKIIFEHFPRTRFIAELISGQPQKVSLPPFPKIEKRE